MVLIVRFITVLGMLLLASSTMAAASAATDPTGLYQARLGDCASCHTAPGGKPYAGGLAIQAPFGTIYSTNITPDKDDGIGNYTLNDFKRALRKGIAKDGHHLYPAMPYPSFAQTSDDDIEALYTYFMQSVAPVHEAVPKTNPIFPFNQRWGITFWNWFFMPHQGFRISSDHDTRWNRGAYMVQTLGHCGACHTPHGPAYEEIGSPGSKTFLSGATLDHWYAPNLREDNATGLGRWSEDDIANFLKSGHGANTAAFGSMTEVVENSFQYMSDDDVRAVAHYIKSLSPHGEWASFVPEAPPRQNEHPGAGIYASACSSCHQLNGTGHDPEIPALAGNPSLMGPDATSLIRIVLQGGASASTVKKPKPSKMPKFDQKLTDHQIADVVNYIRQSWGNNASPAVSERDVAKLREALANK